MTEVPAKIETEEVSVFRSIRHPQKRAFLRAYSELGRIGKAAEAIGMNRDMHYHWLKDEAYAEAFKKAQLMAGNNAEDEVYRRAFDGRDKPLVYEGKISKDEDGNPVTVKEHSDLLAMFFLKGIFPEKYRDNAQINIDNRQLTINTQKGSGFNWEKYHELLDNGPTFKGK